VKFAAITAELMLDVFWMVGLPHARLALDVFITFIIFSYYVIHYFLALSSFITVAGMIFGVFLGLRYLERSA
jgi:hypothetical protein